MSPSSPMLARGTGMATHAASTISVCRYPSTTRSDAWALTAPAGAVDALIQATGLRYISGPQTVQSSRFLNAPGRAPAYSGVQNRTASAAAIDARSDATGGGSGSWSASGSKYGNVSIPP